LRLARRAGVSSVVGGLILTLLFVSMMSALLMVEREHREYVASLRQFQQEELIKSREDLKLTYRVADGTLTIDAKNPSPVAVEVSYVVLSYGGRVASAFNASCTIPPGLSSTLSVPSPQGRPSSVKVVTRRGNVFEAAEGASGSSSTHSSPDGVKAVWPEYSGVQECAAALLAADELFIASAPGQLVPVYWSYYGEPRLAGWQLTTAGARINVYDWEGRHVARVELPEEPTFIALGAGCLAFATSRYVGVANPSTGNLLWAKPLSSANYLDIEGSTETLYVLSGGQYLHAFDLRTGAPLLIDVGGCSFLRSSGPLTVVVRSGSLLLYSRAVELNHTDGGYYSAWIFPERGLIAASVAGSPPILRFFDLSLSLLKEVRLPAGFYVEDLAVADSFWAAITEDDTRKTLWLTIVGADGRAVEVQTLASSPLGIAKHGSSQRMLRSEGNLIALECYSWIGYWKGASWTAWSGGWVLRGGGLAFKVPGCFMARLSRGRLAFIDERAQLSLTRIAEAPLLDCFLELLPQANEVYLRAGGPSKAVEAEAVVRYGPSTNVSLRAASLPKGLSVSLDKSSGVPPFRFTINIEASPELLPREYRIAIVAEADGVALASLPLAVKVYDRPTLIVKNTYRTVSHSSLQAYATSPCFTYSLHPIFDPWRARAYVNVSYRHPYPVSPGWGGALGGVAIPLEAPGPLYACFLHRDLYSGPSGKWEKRLLIYQGGGTWRAAWSVDLADDAQSWKAERVSLEGLLKRGAVNYVALAIAAVSSDAQVGGAWWEARSPMEDDFQLYIYSRDVVTVEGLAEGQVVQVCRADDGSLMGQAVAGPEGRVVVRCGDGQLDPCGYCFVRVTPVDGAPWRSSSLTLYGGDALIFTG